MEIEEFAQYIIVKAQEIGTSDIHILPEELHYSLYFRIGGKMSFWNSVPEENGKRVISYFKYLSNMDVGERRKPQSGASQVLMNGEPTALRFSTITNFRAQESMVIRILNPAAHLSLLKTTYFKKEVQVIEQLAQFNSGLLIFSGPVGSGKTTTMYQLVRESYLISKQQVITVEDPVEIEEPLFLQTQVNEKAGITYETLLKSSLRHHPDTIIIGEIRDEVTAKMVIRGALTGHLIIASVHAKNTVGVVSRLLELGVTQEQLKQTLLGVVFQKLIPKYCPFCKGDCDPGCTHNNLYEKRAILYDVLSRKVLKQFLAQTHSEEEIQEKQTRSFNLLLRKAYAYGYVSEKNYIQFQIP
ncbi:MAG: competence type IV pilus ATPase ComGA [Carnobacterium sp.]|uniref:competence type IV pilus ATPase ComGA n=1 Tax=Carnobacterium sp. TaxID=48221 RepID=UPI0033149596